MWEEKLIKVGMFHFCPTDARTPVAPIIQLWEEIGGFFVNYTMKVRAQDLSLSAEYAVSLDVFQIVEDLKNFDNFGNGAGDINYLLKKIEKKDRVGYAIALDFHLTPLNQIAADCKHTPYRLTNMLLQQIFVAANLCLPGSCSLYNITYPEEKLTKPPSLDCYYLEDCGRFARQEGWPRYKDISFSKVWNWLLASGIHDLDIAVTPVQRAIFCLLEMSIYDHFNLAEILFVAQALEGLLVRDGEPSQKSLSRRIKAIIGSPASHQNWVKDFYNLRSTIIHGNYPIIRGHCAHEENIEVQNYHSQYFLPQLRAVAALVAILQDMADANIAEYHFEQHETLCRKKINS